ncbi:hypothetical protein [Spirulina subsalsa]|uniref:hypothetical protein n=1 Tax=Spirulina subsalsa TaxID=54311 RepID=UPI0003015B09|nr:hypothetical protein [Spirulina subsalsa]
MKQALSLLTLGSLLWLLPLRPSYALPGERTEAVAAWIAANPALRPILSDGLTVQRTDTAAQRFLFRASVFPPGRLTALGNPGIIRSQSFFIYDQINGVSIERLEQSLRDIYGVNIYRDYDRADTVLYYPTSEALEMSRRLNLPGVYAKQGELRVGVRYAYWVELNRDQEGNSHSGKMTIFLKADLDKLTLELQSWQ